MFGVKLFSSEDAGLSVGQLLLSRWLKRSRVAPTPTVFLCLSYDTGNINASADGVNINTAVNLIRDYEGRLKINNITCNAKINRMRAKFSGTLG